MSFRTLSQIAAAFAVTSLLALSPSLAEERAKSVEKPQTEAESTPSAMPPCLQSLTLTMPQQEQIRAIVAEYDADITSVLAEFTDRYRTALKSEAELLCAIEDNLTDAQRTQVRAERRKTAQHQKSLAGTETRPNQSVNPARSAVEAELIMATVALTPEQEAAADKLQEKCLGHLRSLHRDIQGLHTRLVSLEADKLVAIEAVLTKEQLQQLRDERQNHPVAPAVAARDAAANRSN